MSGPAVRDKDTLRRQIKNLSIVDTLSEGGDLAANMSPANRPIPFGNGDSFSVREDDLGKGGASPAHSPQGPHNLRHNSSNLLINKNSRGLLLTVSQSYGSPSPRRPATISEARSVPVENGLGAFISFRNPSTTLMGGGRNVLNSFEQPVGSSTDNRPNSSENHAALLKQLTHRSGRELIADGAPPQINGGIGQSGFSMLAREYLAVGFYNGAQQVAQRDGDILAWAAALILSGNPSKAASILEASIIVALAKELQRRKRAIVNKNPVKVDFFEVFRALVEPQNESLQDYLNSIPVPTEDEFTAINEAIGAVVRKEEVHMWYLTAILLQPDYKPPSNALLRMYFGLYAPDVTRKSARGTKRGATSKALAAAMAAAAEGSFSPQSEHLGNLNKDGKANKSDDHSSPLRHGRKAKPLTRAEAEEILITQCSELEMQVINTYTSFVLRRYRSAVESATAILEASPDDFGMRFIRCVCSLFVSDRRTAIEDCTLMTRSASRFVCSVGLSLATYALPNQNALEALKEIRLSAPEETFVYCIGEWAHGLTLLQQGQFESARNVVAAPIELVTKSRLLTWLLEVQFYANIALKDVEAVVDAPLAPLRELHLSLMQCFGGGFDNSSFQRIEVDSAVGRLLNPPNPAALFIDSRIAVAHFFFKARSMYSFGLLKDAWAATISAVAAAEELLGSLEYCFSDCAPHRVLLFGINVGLAYADQMAATTDEVDHQVILSKDPIERATARRRRLEDDALGDEIMKLCRIWAKKIRYYYPRVISGYCAVAQVAIAAQEVTSIERASTISDTFPQSVLAQNLMPYALYARYLIPDAIATARRALHRFPHVPEVRSMFRAISDQQGSYSHAYRSIVPVTFAYGDTRPLYARTIGMGLLIVFHLLLIAFVVSFERLTDYFSLPESVAEKFPVSGFVPAIIVGVWVLYAIMGMLFDRSLVSFIFKDLHLRDTAFQRAVFIMRGVGYANIATAGYMWQRGSMDRMIDVWQGFPILIIIILIVLTWPLSTRVFFLRSLDEPDTGFSSWLTMALLDVISFVGLAPLHITLTAIEPLSFLLFFFFMPLAEEETSGDVKLRLAQQLARPQARQRWQVGSGSNYFHLVLLRALYMDTHSDLETKYALKMQEEEDDYRAFPTIFLLETIPKDPLQPPHERRAALLRELMQQAMLDGGEGGGDGDAHSAIEMSPLGTAGSPASIASLRKQRLRLLPLDDAFAAGQSVAPISFSPASPHLSNANQNNNANDPRFVPSIASPHAALIGFPAANVSAGNDASSTTFRHNASGIEPISAAAAGQDVSVLQSTLSNYFLRQHMNNKMMSNQEGLFGEYLDSDSEAEVDRVFKDAHSRVAVNTGPLSIAGSPIATSLASPSNTNRLPTSTLNRPMASHGDRRTMGDVFAIRSTDDRNEAIFVMGGLRQKILENATVDRPPTAAVASPFEAPSAAAAAAFSTGGVGGGTIGRPSSRPNTRSNADRRRLSMDVLNRLNSTFGVLESSDSDTLSATKNTVAMKSRPTTGGDRPRSGMGAAVGSAATINTVTTNRLGSGRSRNSTPGSFGLTNTASNAALGKPPPPTREVGGAHPNRLASPRGEGSTRLKSPRQGHRKRDDTPVSEGGGSSKSASTTRGTSRDGHRRPASSRHIPPKVRATGGGADPESTSDDGNNRLRKDRVSSAASSNRRQGLGQGGSIRMAKKRATPQSQDEGSPSPTDAPLPDGAVERTLSPHRRKQPGALTRAPSNTRSLVLRNVTSAPSGVVGGVDDFDDDTKSLGGASASNVVVASPNLASSPKGDLVAAVNGNLKIRKLLDDFKVAMTLNSTSKEQAAKLQHGAKIRLVQGVLQIGSRVSVQPIDSKQQLMKIYEDVMKEGDGVPGNLEVLNCLLNTIVTLEVPSTIIATDRHIECAEKGYHRFVELILKSSFVQPLMDITMYEKLLSKALTLPIPPKRIAVFLSIIKSVDHSPLCQSRAVDMQPLWQSAFEQVIASGNSPINYSIMPSEDVERRRQLITVATTHPTIALNCFGREAKDKQTIFSRACREGDLVFVEMLLKLEGATPEAVNRVQSDGTNALQQAAARSHAPVCQYLLKHPDIDPSLSYVYPGKGTALQIAIALKRSEKIIEALKEKTAEIERKKAGLTEAKPQTAGLERRRSSMDLKKRPSVTQVAYNNIANGVAGGGAGLGHPTPPSTAPTSGQAGSTSPIPEGAKRPVDVTVQVRGQFAVFRPLYERIHQSESDGVEVGAVGTRAADLLKTLNDTKRILSTTKLSAASRLDRMGTDLKVEGEDVRREILWLVDQLLGEADEVEGNMEILTSVLKHFKVTMGLVGLSVTGRWISKAAAKANYQYFKLLLSQEGVAEALQHYQLQSKMAPITDIVTSAVGALKDRLEKFEGPNPKAGATSSSSSVQGGGGGLTRTASTLHVVIAKSYVKVLLVMLSDMKETLGYSKHAADDKLKAQWQLLAFTVFHSSHKSVLARVGIAEVNGGQQVNLNAQGKIAISGFQKGGTAAANDSKSFTPPDLCSLLVAEIASDSIHADFTVSEDPASHLTILGRACFEGNAPLIAYLLEAKAGLVLKASNIAKKGNQPPRPSIT